MRTTRMMITLIILFNFSYSSFKISFSSSVRKVEIPKYRQVHTWKMSDDVKVINNVTFMSRRQALCHLTCQRLIDHAKKYDETIFAHRHNRIYTIQLIFSFVCKKQLLPVFFITISFFTALVIFFISFSDECF